MGRAAVRLHDGQVIELRLEGDLVVIDSRDWRQSLTRDDAWALAEALDAVATGGSDDGR